jgi:hypothetical protein
MTHFSGHDRSEALLLAEALDDYVAPDNPVRFIHALSMGWILRRPRLAVLSRR